MKFLHLSVGAAALATLAACQGVLAHNSAKYNGIPFVVPGACANTSPQGSASFISQNRQLVLQVTNGDSESSAGWEVFSSTPGTNTGNITPSASTTAPAGTYSFTVSGLPSSGLRYTTLQSNGSYEPNFVSISNGTVSVVPEAPGSGTTVAVTFFITNTPNGITSPYTVSNFRVNNSPLLVDTTHTDVNIETDFTWCLSQAPP